MTAILAILLVVVLVACWALNLVSLPGNWLILIVVTLYALIGPSESRIAVSWATIVVLLLLAVLGEVAEFLAGVIGVRRQGGSRRGAALALVGSVVGAVTGAAIGVPIPVVGSLVAAVLFAGVGAFVGAMLGESWKGRPTGDQMKIGVAAFWGRMLGTVTKLALGAVMIAVSIIALVVA